MLKQTVVNKLTEIKAWTNSQFCIKINNQIN